MTDEKWKYIVGNIKDSFNVISHKTEAGEFEHESIEELVFENPAGTMKLARHIKPRMLGEKTHYSTRIGSSTGIEKVYSDTETVDYVTLYRDVGGEWKEMDVAAIGK